MIKIKKGIPLIDQHDKNFMYGNKFGGNFVPETLKKPIDDLTKLFTKLRKDKSFIKERDYYFKNYIGTPTPLIKLNNLTEYLGGAQIYAKVVSEANGGAHKIYNATVHCLVARRAGKKYVIGEAKFLTDHGGHQNAQFNDAIATMNSDSSAEKIAILDGVLFIEGKNKMHKSTIKEYENGHIMSALVLREFLYQL